LILISLAVVTLVLSACGGETPPDTAPVADATRSPTARPAPSATPRPPAATSTPAPNRAAGAASDAIDIGSRLQLFVDDYLIEEISGVELNLHRPVPMETVLEFDQPWENDTNGYFTVFKDDDRYRMYYRCSAVVAERTCYAESEDGVIWTRPELGIIEFEGSTKNNMIWTGDVSHNFAAFKDTNPAAAADQRYKALGGQPPQAFVSADGVHWRELADGPVLTSGAFDSQNVAFWDGERGHYVAYYRIWSDDDVRAIGTSISDDFVNWTDHRAIDLGDAPQEHLYTNATTPYFRAPDILLSFPKRFQPERKVVESHPHSGVSDSVFMTSRDGLNFERTFMEAFLRPGRELRNWTERSNMVAWGVVPTAKDEISVYYSQHYRHPSSHLERGVLRVDGFVSVNAPFEGGELITRPLVFSGDILVLNYATSGVGSIRVEVQDADGRPITNYTLRDAREMYGDEVDGQVYWSSTTVGRVQRLEGQPVRLRFVMKDADLYSFRFVDRDDG
jgi:hypothetical protein